MNGFLPLFKSVGSLLRNSARNIGIRIPAGTVLLVVNSRRLLSMELSLWSLLDTDLTFSKPNQSVAALLQLVGKSTNVPG